MLLVDDPYSALDPARRDRLLTRLAERPGQVFLSRRRRGGRAGARRGGVGVRGGVGSRASPRSDEEGGLMPDAKGFGGRSRPRSDEVVTLADIVDG